MFLAKYGAGNAAGALLTERAIPPAVHAQLMHDPDFLRTLASAYSAVGRDADAQRVLRSALDLPFPAGGRGVKVDTQLQYAGLLQQANHLDQAAGLFRQVIAADPSNASGWEGLIRVEHAMKQDSQAVETFQSMSTTVYGIAMRDPGFETTVASIYQSQNRLDVAQSILEKAVGQETKSGIKPSVAVETQLAGIYLAQNNTRQAYPLYPHDPFGKSSTHRRLEGAALDLALLRPRSGGAGGDPADSSGGAAHARERRPVPADSRRHL